MNGRTLFAPLLLVLAALPASATTYVLPPDEALVRQAAVVAQVTVEAVEPAPIDGPPSTDYFVQVERVLKGYVAGGTVVVRVPGGIGPDGRGLRIWGAPRFHEGDRLLLFLEPRRDGTYGLLHLMLGTFVERQAGERRVAVRPLAEAVEVSFSADGALLGDAEPMRDFQGFADWVGERAAGSREPGDYLIEQGAAVPVSPANRSELLEDPCTGLNLRWFEFDRDESVTWLFHYRGFNGTGGGRRAFDRARRAWSRRSGLAIRFDRTGRTGADAGLTEFDELNTVLFNDPNQVISGSFRCASGGVVSVTGVWFENGRGQSCERARAARRGTHQGRKVLEILGADIVTNEGTACLFGGDPAITSQVLAHELGHSLGLAHGAGADGLMHGAVDRLGGSLAPGEAERAAAGLLYRPRPVEE